MYRVKLPSVFLTKLIKHKTTAVSNPGLYTKGETDKTRTRYCLFLEILTIPVIPQTYPKYGEGLPKSSVIQSNINAIKPEWICGVHT